MANAKERADPSGPASSKAGEVIPCATCQHAAPANFRFCPECGTRLPFFRQKQILEGRFQVVRLISQDGENDIYEIRKLEGRDKPDPTARSTNIAPAAVPVAPVAPAFTSGPAELGAAAPPPPAAAPLITPIATQNAAAASPATRDISPQNRYNPLAKKRAGLGTILGIVILAALVIWAIWIMARPGTDTPGGDAEITSTAPTEPETGNEAISEGASGTVAPVVTLPPNIAADPAAVSGEGSILRELPADVTQQTAPSPLAQTAPVETATATDGRNISERQAVNIILTGVNRTDYYGLDFRCIAAASASFVNEGYTIELVSRNCPGSSRSPGQLLGRWRVDAKTGQAYVENADGKYVSP